MADANYSPAFFLPSTRQSESGRGKGGRRAVSCSVQGGQWTLLLSVVARIWRQTSKASFYEGVGLFGPCPQQKIKPKHKNQLYFFSKIIYRQILFARTVCRTVISVSLQISIRFGFKVCRFIGITLSFCCKTGTAACSGKVTAVYSSVKFMNTTAAVAPFMNILHY